MIDSHAHLDLFGDSAQLEAQLSAAREAGISGWIVPALLPSGPGSAFHQAIASSGWAGSVRVCAGFHPWVAKEHPELFHADGAGLESALSAAVERLDPVAIGEVGFDPRPGNAFPGESQIIAFRAACKVAVRYNKPLIIHLVRSEHWLFQALNEARLPGPGGVVHGFSGGPELASALLRRGLHLGLGPALARALERDPAGRLVRAAASIPLDRILIETDAPDQARELRALEGVAVALAQVRQISADEVREATAKNARRLFSWPN